ncbi:ArnT family glycosyltransferase [Simiduia agarivorans]|uniref:ArnT family glycosyltransferase n=1 Tax=Simiduia agarivorans TaxID=447471 RepID=UPI00138ACCDE|nr:glycosyltransferase family 39 protein [Simiduia agarivorans]
MIHPTTHKVLLGFALVHLILAASLPLALFEAHYALYGVHWQLSYVDHPPLMGWLQGLVQLVSHADMAQRLIPIGITLGTQYLLVLLALRLFPDQPGIDRTTAWVVQLIPISHIGFMAAPDLPLMLFSLLTFWCCLNILEQQRWRDWLLMGLCIGLAGLSKYTAVTLVVSLALVLWHQHRHLRWLAQPKLWLAAVVGGLCVLPVLWWNYQHDWISFTFQMEYQGGDGWSLPHMAQALANQLIAYSPLVLLAFLPVQQPGHQHARARLWCWAAPLLLLFAYQAGAGRSSEHWTYSAWLLLAPLMALQLRTLWHKLWLRRAVYTWGILLSLVFALLIAAPWLSFKDFKHPLGKISGWPPASERANQLLNEWRQELADTEPQPTLAVQNWHHAEPLAWYGRPVVVRDMKHETSQYSQWFGHFAPGDRGLLVRPSKRTEAPEIQSEAAECTWVDSLPVYLNKGIARVYHFYRCQW